jgi:hypothetical protein
MTDKGIKLIKFSQLSLRCEHDNVARTGLTNEIPMNSEYTEQGAFLSRSLLSAQDLAPICSAILSMIKEYIPEAETIQNPEWVRFASDNPDIVTAV